MSESMERMSYMCFNNLCPTNKDEYGALIKEIKKEKKLDVLVSSYEKFCLSYSCCQTAHCGRYIPHFDFSAKPSPIVPYRHLPQSLSGMTADCRSLV